MDLSKQKTSLGLDEKNNLVYVTKELVQDRVAREQRFSDNLRANNAVDSLMLATIATKPHQSLG